MKLGVRKITIAIQVNLRNNTPKDFCYIKKKNKNERNKNPQQQNTITDISKHQNAAIYDYIQNYQLIFSKAVTVGTHSVPACICHVI